jgi:hypothetical protein
MDDKIGVVFTFRRVWEAKRDKARRLSKLQRWRDTTFPLKKWGMQLLEDLILFILTIYLIILWKLPSAAATLCSVGKPAQPVATSSHCPVAWPQWVTRSFFARMFRKSEKVNSGNILVPVGEAYTRPRCHHSRRTFYIPRRLLHSEARIISSLPLITITIVHEILPHIIALAAPLRPFVTAYATSTFRVIFSHVPLNAFLTRIMTRTSLSLCDQISSRYRPIMTCPTLPRTISMPDNSNYSPCLCQFYSEQEKTTFGSNEKLLSEKTKEKWERKVLCDRIWQGFPLLAQDRTPLSVAQTTLFLYKIANKVRQES